MRIDVANISGQGVIKHIWMTPAFRPPSASTWRSLILRLYWDDEKTPSVEVPLGDFFAMGGYGFYVWGSYAMTVVLIAIEIVAVRARFRAAREAARATSDQR